MGRVKWNQLVNSKDTNLNEVQKLPPRCLKNFMPGGGYMRKPFDGSKSRADKINNSAPPAASPVGAQPGGASRVGELNLKELPGVPGRLHACWSQDVPNSAPRDGTSPSKIQSNLTDIPSIFGRKYVSQK